MFRQFEVAASAAGRCQVSYSAPPRPAAAHPQQATGRRVGRLHNGFAFRLRRSCLDLRRGLHVRSAALEPAESPDRVLRSVAHHRQAIFAGQLKGRFDVHEINIPKLSPSELLCRLRIRLRPTGFQFVAALAHPPSSLPIRSELQFPDFGDRVHPPKWSASTIFLPDIRASIQSGWRPAPKPASTLHFGKSRPAVCRGTVIV